MLTITQTLIVPAVISLILFLASTYVFIPLWRRYQARYSQYLPLETISNHTSSFRSRVQDAMGRWLVPSQWRFRLGERLGQADDASDAGFSSDGEELDDVLDDERRRALSLDPRGDRIDSIRRLSRE